MSRVCNKYIQDGSERFTIVLGIACVPSQQRYVYFFEWLVFMLRLSSVKLRLLSQKESAPTSRTLQKVSSAFYSHPEQLGQTFLHLISLKHESNNNKFGWLPTERSYIFLDVLMYLKPFLFHLPCPKSTVNLGRHSSNTYSILFLLPAIENQYWSTSATFLLRNKNARKCIPWNKEVNAEIKPDSFLETGIVLKSRTKKGLRNRMRTKSNFQVMVDLCLTQKVPIIRSAWQRMRVVVAWIEQA